jgi:hypothetical protein
MKNTNSVIVAILFTGLMAQSCEKMTNQIEGIGTITTNSLEVDNFSKIRMEGADNVIISYGEEQEVKVTGHPNIISRIQTEVSNGTWDIELESGNYGDYELTYNITIPSIEEVSNIGSGNVTVEDSISVDYFRVSLIGSGGFFGFPLSADQCDVYISGSGNIEVTAVEDMDVVVDGSGSVFYKGSPIIHEDITGSGRVIDSN